MTPDRTGPTPTGPTATGRRVLVNTSALGAANALRIGASFLIQLLVARRLGAAALGDYAVLMAWLNVGQVLSDGGLPALVVREMAGRPTLRRAWHNHMRAICLLLSLLVWIAFLGIAALLPAMRPRLPLLAVVGAALPLYALFSAHISVFEASERMEPLLWVDAGTNAALLLGVSAALWLGGDISAVIWIAVAGQGFAALAAGLLVRRSGLLRPPQEALALQPTTTLRRAAPFFGIAVADVLQQRADLLLLSAVAPAGVTGFYAAATSIVRVGIKLVGATWRAIYPTLSRLRTQDAVAFAGLDARAVRTLALLTLPVAAIGTVVSASLMRTLFGPGYAPAGEALALLLWAIPLYAWEVRCSTLLAAVGRPRGGLIAAMVHVGVVLLLLPLLAAAAGTRGAAAAALAAGAAGAIAGSLALARAGLPQRGRAVLPAAPVTLAAGAAAWLLPFLWPGQAAAGLLVAGAAARLFGAITRHDLRALRRALSR